jgi:hypothetical protein
MDFFKKCCCEDQKRLPSKAKHLIRCSSSSFSSDGIVLVKNMMERCSYIWCLATKRL